MSRRQQYLESYHHVSVKPPVGLSKASLWLQDLESRSMQWMAALRQIPQWKPGLTVQSLFYDRFLNFCIESPVMTSVDTFLR